MNKAKAITASVDHSETRRLAILLLMAITAYLLCISPAFAASLPGSKITEVLCSIYGLIAFDIGRGLSTLAIVALGIGAMLGRVTWGQFATVAVGIGTTLGAIVIAYALLPFDLIATTPSLIACAGYAAAAQTNSIANSFFGSLF